MKKTKKSKVNLRKNAENGINCKEAGSSQLSKTGETKKLQNPVALKIDDKKGATHARTKKSEISKNAKRSQNSDGRKQQNKKNKMARLETSRNSTRPSILLQNGNRSAININNKATFKQKSQLQSSCNPKTGSKRPIEESIENEVCKRKKTENTLCDPTSQNFYLERFEEYSEDSEEYSDKSSDEYSEEYSKDSEEYSEEYSEDSSEFEFDDNFIDGSSDTASEYDADNLDFSFESDTEDNFSGQYRPHFHKDADYIPPKEYIEDLIIHKGTAVKRDLCKDECMLLDSDNEDAHVVENEQYTNVKIIVQPSGYKIEALEEINTSFANAYVKVHNDKSSTAITKVSNSDYESCPELISVTNHVDISSSSDQSSSDGEFVSDSEYIYITDDSSNEESSISKDDSDKAGLNVSILYSKEEMKQKELPLLKEKNHEQKKSTPLEDMLQPTFKEATSFVSINLNEDDIPGKILLQKYANHEEKASALAEPEASIHTKKDSRTIQEYVPDSVAKKGLSLYFNAVTSNDVLVVVKDAIFIYGTLQLKLLRGCVDIYGHKPKLNEILQVYSPKGFSLVHIEPFKLKVDPNQSNELASVLKPFEVHFCKDTIKKILYSYVEGFDAILLLQRNIRAKKLVGNFKKFMNENVFPNMNSLPKERPHYASEYLLQCVLNSESEKALQVPLEWLYLKLSAHTKMLIAGGKSVGKSTLLRYLINRHLSRFPHILLIDLDIGQPELFVPQTISCFIVKKPLLGPGFFLNAKPAKAYMVGSVNVTMCELIYMRAVKKLLAFCQDNEEYANIPWVINTMGYNRGFGLEIISVIADYLKPTDIIQLQSSKDINNYEILLEPQKVRNVQRIIYNTKEFNQQKESEPESRHIWQLHVLHSAALPISRYQKEWAMSPKDFRYAMVIARLSAALVDGTEWLTDCKPLSASLNDVKIINVLKPAEICEELAAAFDANLVYLCTFSENSKSFECYGIGVVRAIDRFVRNVYLVPAVEYNILSKVNCLALGDMPLPNSFFTNQGPRVRGTAPFVFQSVDLNSTKAIKQIYHRPSEFLNATNREI